MLEPSRTLSAIFSVLLLGTSVTAQPDPNVLAEQGHYKQARTILEKRLAANPKDPDALAGMASVKLIFKDFDGATKLAEQAVALKPNDVRTHAVLADCYGSQAEGDVGMFQGLRLVHSFKNEAEQALAIDPKDYQTLHNMMQFYLTAPGIAGGSKSKATEMADKIAALDASRGFLAKAEIALHEKQADQLEGFYLKAVEANPKSYEALIKAASLYLGEKLRNLSKAEGYAQKAVEHDPGRAVAYSILAGVKVFRGDFPEAEKILASAEKAVPDDLLPYYRAGRVLLSSGKDDARAEKYFRKYLTQQPEGATPTLAVAHWQLGLVLEKQGKLQEAIQEVQTAIKMDSSLKGAKEDLKRMQ